MVNATFASILRSGRTQFNESFVIARRLYPELEPEQFSDFLSNRVDPIVEAVASVNADRAAEVAMVAYNTSLALVGQRLAGSNARLVEIDDGWRKLLPKIPSLVMSAPSRVLPAVSNAIHQLASTPNARTKQWTETMETLGPQCENVETFLRLGQFVAWLAGLAHMREGALNVSEEVPENLIVSALRLNDGTSWASVRSRLMVDPWCNPNVQEQPDTPRIAARVGSFRGFGGLFTTPPLVAATDKHFLARSGDESWLLTADSFGATFHRATVDEFQSAVTHTVPSQNISLDRSTVSIAGKRIEFPDLGYFTSSASNETTLALTSALTHSIILVALR